MNFLLSIVALGSVACAGGATVYGSARLGAPALEAAELGRVRWRRDFDEALAEASAEKPAFVLFQEVPGCSTCVGFGRGPLSLPLVVEAIEDLFVPVLVFNNKGGEDGKRLTRFGEPAWNNPVVRFLDASGADVLPRRDGVWTTAGLVERMRAALGERAPSYLEIVEQESDVGHHGRAVFAMHCFWEGEAKLGALDGVVWTRPAFVGADEVVEVTFHVRETSFTALVRRADELDCAAKVYALDDEQLERARRVVGERATECPGALRDAEPSDANHSLNASPLRFVPLTAMQATRVNAELASGRDALGWLSPRQRALAERVAGALAADEHLLDGFVRPQQIARLDEYAADLEARLAANEAQ